MKKGSLACVGTGMMLGAHIGPRARRHIEEADVVFVAVSDPLVEKWVQGMNADVRSLQPYYVEGKPRTETYREMVAAIMAEVREGRRVCGAFYGHPGVFAGVPHRAVAQASQEGHTALMEAAVSAEDCLYADLGVDPGTYGCQHYETSQFMFYRRRIDLTAYLVLWQVGVAGDQTLARLSSTGAGARQILVDLLAEHGYSSSHEVIAYEAAVVPIHSPRIDHMRLAALPDADLRLQTTLVIPPFHRMERNEEVLARLGVLPAGGG